MAEFSKQWCEKHDPEGIKPDFDIMEIFNGLEEEDTYTSVICEGYGFIAIGKKKDNPNPELLFGFDQAIKQGYWTEPIPDGLNEEDCVWIKMEKLK